MFGNVLTVGWDALYLVLVIIFTKAIRCPRFPNWAILFLVYGEKKFIGAPGPLHPGWGKPFPQTPRNAV